MRTMTFDELPPDVRGAVVEQTGSVTDFVPAPVGNHAEIAGVVRASGGWVFVKGTRLMPGEAWGGAEAWSLRNEAALVPHASPFAPDLLWLVETEGWLVLGFEQIDARHASYRPGSPDLELVAGVVEGLSGLVCPDVVRLRVEGRYLGLDPAASVLAGDCLVHCDLNPSNVLITDDGGVRVVDWAFGSRGAGWVELGFLLPWMVRDGHSFHQAEAWLTARFGTWKTVAGDGRADLFASLLTRAWARRDVPGADAWVREYAGIVRAWNAHRHGVVEPASD